MPKSASSVVHACYTPTKAGSSTVVLQDVGTTCSKSSNTITWNQTGPQGLKGDTGAPGPAGPQGLKGDTGPQGLKGDTGAAGPQGPQGAAGADGHTILNGAGAPDATIGHDGDFYLDTAANVLYGPKANGSWPANGVSLVGAPGPAGPQGLVGPLGPAGADGHTILNGTGAPGVSVGHDGDFYLDTIADVLYGPKAGGTWPIPGTSLVGPQGPAGSPRRHRPTRPTRAGRASGVSRASGAGRGGRQHGAQRHRGASRLARPRW
jgi:hypothetical protein